VKRCVSITTVCVVSGVLFAWPADGQCPAGATNQLLVGTWTYSTQGSSAISTAFASAGPYAAAGQFTAGIGTDRSGTTIGVLKITQTSNLNGGIVSQETDVGRYQVFPDCSGGTLTFNLSTRPLQFDFWFVSNTEIRFVSTTAGITVHGSAKSTSGAVITVSPREAQAVCTTFAPQAAAQFIINPEDLFTKVVQGLCGPGRAASTTCDDAGHCVCAVNSPGGCSDITAKCGNKHITCGTILTSPFGVPLDGCKC